MEELAARFVYPLVGMSAKVIALSLQQVRGEPLASIGIVEGQGGAERRHGNAFFRRGGNDVTPRFLSLLDRLLEERVEQQIYEFRMFVVGFFDFAEECAADDATATPHQRDAAVIQIPFLFLRRRAHE